MKKIYKIGTKQEFIYAPYKLFGKKINPEKHWVIRNVKYIYANNKEEAKAKYEKGFFIEYPSIMNRWGNWYLESKGISIFMREKHIDITSTKIVLIDEDKDIDVNLKTLVENMLAEDFKEWFNDGCCGVNICQD